MTKFEGNIREESRKRKFQRITEGKTAQMDTNKLERSRWGEEISKISNFSLKLQHWPIYCIIDSSFISPNLQENRSKIYTQSGQEQLTERGHC